MRQKVKDAVSGDESKEIYHYLFANKLQIRHPPMARPQTGSLYVLCLEYIHGVYMSDTSNSHILMLLSIEFYKALLRGNLV